MIDYRLLEIGSDERLGWASCITPAPNPKKTHYDHHKSKPSTPRAAWASAQLRRLSFRNLQISR